MSRLDVILEAKKRGLPVSAQDEAILSEASRRGLVESPAVTGKLPGPSVADTYGSRVPETLVDSIAEQGHGAIGRIGSALGGLIPTAEERAAKQPDIRDEAKFLASLGINMGGSVAGAMGGAAMAGPAGGVAGEMVGSYGARKLNVALGLEEPGMVGDIASVAAPPVLRGAGALIKGVAKRLPGVGTAMQEEGVEQARAIPPALTPKVPSDLLYKRVAQQNPTVKLDEVKRVAQHMLDEQMKLAPKQRSAPIVDTAEGWLEMANAPNGADFQSVWLAQKQLRQKIWGGEGLDHRARGQIDAAIMHDFESIGRPASGGKAIADLTREDLREMGHMDTTYDLAREASHAQASERASQATQAAPIAGLLKAANKAYRKERGVETLNEIIESGITRPQGQADAIERLNAGNMLKKFDAKVRQDDLFAGAFTGSEQQEIRSILTDLSKIPLPGPVSGAMYGAGLGLGAGSTGFALGLDPQASAGITATMTILPHLLGTKPGRAMVRGLMRSDKLMTPEGLAAVRGFMRSTGQEATE